VAQSVEAPPQSAFDGLPVVLIDRLTATRIVERLIRLDQDTWQVRLRDGGEAGAR
jgi:hypothetical protein